MSNKVDYDLRIVLKNKNAITKVFTEKFLNDLKPTLERNHIRSFSLVFSDFSFPDLSNENKK